ncbi:MAG TPA: hypothetical protein VJT31_16300 [Rugosimonospora sp.]|nr:hypothetical protein [Rugosimonospora sp.]
MTRRQKILTVAVFAVLVMLYAGAAATGSGSGGGDAGTRPGGLVGWLGHLVPGPREVPASQLRAGCLSGTTLTVQGGCTLTVPKGAGTRRVRLHADQPMTVTARPPGQQQPAATQVRAGTDLDVTVNGDGGPIDLACTGAATCTAHLPGE